MIIKKFLIVLCLLCLPVFANDITWIEENHDGKVIITPEHVIIISDYDIADTQLWLEGDEVIITDSGYIVNTDEGERAEIQAINFR